MQIEIGALIVAAAALITRIKAILGYIGQKWTQIEPVILPLILEAEKACASGKIDRAARKQLVMDGVALAQEQGLFKLNAIEKIFLPYAINKIAESLPDIVVSQQAQAIIQGLIDKK